MWVIIRAFVAASFERVEGEAIVVGVLGVWVLLGLLGRWGGGKGRQDRGGDGQMLETESAVLALWSQAKEVA